jgi:hypothetical protein
MPNSVMQMPLDEEESQLGWKLEELLAQRLKERDEIWGKRMSEELAKRRRLMRAIEAKLGPEGLVELVSGKTGNDEGNSSLLFVDKCHCGWHRNSPKPRRLFN